MDLTAQEAWVGGILVDLCALLGRHAMMIVVTAPFTVPSATADYIPLTINGLWSVYETFTFPLLTLRRDIWDAFPGKVTCITLFLEQNLHTFTK